MLSSPRPTAMPAGGVAGPPAQVTLWFGVEDPFQSCSGPVLGWERARECRSVPGGARAGSQGSARSVPGDREGVTRSLGEAGAPVALPPTQAMLDWAIPSCGHARSAGLGFGPALLVPRKPMLPPPVVPPGAPWSHGMPRAPGCPAVLPPLAMPCRARRPIRLQRPRPGHLRPPRLARPQPRAGPRRD